jgi:hypothetical protein
MNMWFLNKETGLSWEVTDQELIQRLQVNVNYEQVDEPNRDKMPDTKNTKRNDKESV